MNENDWSLNISAIQSIKLVRQRPRNEREKNKHNKEPTAYIGLAYTQTHTELRQFYFDIGTAIESYFKRNFRIKRKIPYKRLGDLSENV